MKAHDDMLDSVASYMLGTLPAEEAGAVLDHVRSCPQCTEECRNLSASVTAVAYSAEAGRDTEGTAVPSELLKARIMRSVRAQRAKPAAASWIVPSAAAFVALALLASAASNLFLESRLHQARGQIARQEAEIGDLTAPTARRYPFGTGEIVTNGSRLYISARALAALPANRVYQAWTLRHGAARVAPSVTFRPNRAGTALVALPEDARDTAAVAVSVEPDGGSRQPTTKPVILVKISP